MSRNNYITISNNKCDSCYRCVRECKVKAIKFNHRQPEIVDDRCVYCGDCIDICPSGVIKIESQIEKVKRAIKNNDIIIASLSPGWIAEFKDIEPARMIEAIKLLGFTHVSETALGAAMVAEECATILSKSDDFYISSTCPATTELINTYYPDLSSHIIEVVPPVVAHARMLKEVYGQNSIVVAIDACVGTKHYCEDENNDLFAALTFAELQEWMDEDDVRFDLIPGGVNYFFEPFTSTDSNLYIVPRGVYNHNFLNEHNLPKHSIYNYSGVSRVKEVLGSLQSETAPKNVFIELSGCTDGCLSGKGCIDNINFITKRAIIGQYELKEHPQNLDLFPECDLFKEFKPKSLKRNVGEEDIADALETLFMELGKEPVNCGSCGYVDCRSFAVALVEGYTKPEMCLYYLKEEAKNRFTKLISKLYSGVAVIDNKLSITEANYNFALMLGAETKMMYEVNPGMVGTKIVGVVPLHDKISEHFAGDDDVTEFEVQIKDKMVKFFIITLQKHKSVCLLARNMFTRDAMNDQIVRSSRQIINDNLEAVQKIAYLLGDTVSKTEAVLNTIIESQSIEDAK